jgi:hypothetical protein
MPIKDQYPMPASPNLDRRAKLCGVLALVTLIAGIVTASAGKLPTRRALPEGVKSPTLALELIRPGTPVIQIAASPAEENQLRKGVYTDFAFIPAYALFFVGVAFFSSQHVPKVGRLLAALIAVAAIGAATADVFENIGMLAVLNHVPGAAPRTASLWKWGLLFLAIGGSAPAFVDRAARPFRWVLGWAGAIVAVAAAIGGLAGTILRGADGLIGHDTMIEAAAARTGLTLLVAAVFFMTRVTLRDGVLPALDRLAEYHALSWLVDWPSADRDEVIGEPLVERLSEKAVE